MSTTENCPFCHTVIDSRATVCRGCGAQKRQKYDRSTFGYIKGYFASVVASIFFGVIVGYMFNAGAGLITGLSIGGLSAFLVGRYGCVVTYWTRRGEPAEPDIEPTPVKRPVHVEPVQRVVEKRATKECPDCAEEVALNARVCKHCTFRFPTEAAKKPAAKKTATKKPAAKREKVEVTEPTFVDLMN